MFGWKIVAVKMTRPGEPQFVVLFLAAVTNVLAEFTARRESHPTVAERGVD